MLFVAKLILVFPIPTIEFGPPEYEKISGPENIPLFELVKSTNRFPSPVPGDPITFSCTSEYVVTPLKGFSPCLST